MKKFEPLIGEWGIIWGMAVGGVSMAFLRCVCETLLFKATQGDRGDKGRAWCSLGVCYGCGMVLPVPILKH
jgi:hypothetical protein